MLWRLALVLVSPLSALANSAPPPSSDPIVILYSTGPVGVILVVGFWAVVKGHIVAGREHDRVVAENDKLRAQVPDVVAALTNSTEVVKEGTRVQNQALILQQQMLDRLAGRSSRARPT